MSIQFFFLINFSALICEGNLEALDWLPFIEEARSLLLENIKGLSITTKKYHKNLAE